MGLLLMIWRVIDLLEMENMKGPLFIKWECGKTDDKTPMFDGWYQPNFSKIRDGSLFGSSH